MSGTTRVYGIFGDPVAHSRSPQMQNAAFAATGIDAVYLPFHVLPRELPAAVAGIRALRIRGVNLTIPHKEKILPLLDALDEEAQLIGAVNTVANRDGRLVGYNTDGKGLLRALQTELAFDPRGQHVLLLGAGGACRAALVALARAGAAWIGLANRDLQRAHRLAEEFAPSLKGTQLAALPLTAEGLRPVLPALDLLVNTTAVGLHGEGFPFDPVAALAADARVYDMVYAIAPTPLAQAAARRGLAMADGRGMLAGQGEEAFRLWTGQRPPAGVMRACLFAESAAK